MIAKCNCKHDWQDRKYGKGKRVHTEASGKKSGTKKISCTVCGSQK